MKTEFNAVKKDFLQRGIVFAFISAGSCCGCAVKCQDNGNSMGLYPLFMFPATASPYLREGEPVLTQLRQEC